MPAAWGATVPSSLLISLWVYHTRYDGVQKLFISPHKSLTFSSIAHWIKKSFNEAGIDEWFTVHFMRAASAIAASMSGIFMKEITTNLPSSNSTIDWRSWMIMVALFQRNMLTEQLNTKGCLGSFREWRKSSHVIPLKYLSITIVFLWDNEFWIWNFMYL